MPSLVHVFNISNAAVNPRLAKNKTKQKNRENEEKLLSPAFLPHKSASLVEDGNCTSHKLSASCGHM